MAHIGAQPACARQLGEKGDEDAARARAEIEEGERAAAQALPREMSERRLDQGLGIGAGSSA
jgi:hypothetical protein